MVSLLVVLTAISVIALIFILAHHFLGAHPVKIFETLMREFAQLLNREWTTGAVNAAGLIVVFVFGFLIFLANEVHALLSMLISVLGQGKAHEYSDSVSAITIFIVLVTMAVLSAFFTLVRETSGR